MSPNVWHVELTPATGGVLTCLQEIAAVMGLRDLVNSAAYIQRAIFQKVRNTSGLPRAPAAGDGEAVIRRYGSEGTRRGVG